MSGKLKDLKVLLSGDIVGFHVDSIGYLATPSSYEPIPEKEEAVSHVRICTAPNILEADANRCMFRIESDIGQVYSSINRFTIAINYFYLRNPKFCLVRS